MRRRGGFAKATVGPTRASAAVVALLAIAGGLCVVGAGCKRDDGNSDTPVVAVVPKGTSHVFWQSIHAGAIKAGREFGVKIEFMGPASEKESDKQRSIVEDFLVRRVAGIVLAPCDENVLVPVIGQAHASKIPLVIIDSGANTDQYVSFVATDNYQGGVLGARRLAEVLGGKGRVLLVKYAPGSASTTQRENGFRDTITKEFPPITIVEERYAGTDRAEARAVVDDLLLKHKDLDGIFAVNESSTFGTLEALGGAGKAGTIKFVGFDSSEELIDGLRKGEILGLVLQDPFNMGYLGVKTLLEARDGKNVERRIPTNLVVATPENMKDPAIAQLLSPDLSAYLK